MDEFCGGGAKETVGVTEADYDYDQDHDYEKSLSPVYPASLALLACLAVQSIVVERGESLGPIKWVD